ncbi:MDR family MFS transporter [Humibacter albus]|uniref:MDR family MFS transporter n=1 Tax=Humibacter albus TaxID=427754 RepID=UPI0003B773D8|nr:MDR family MFS transporter [Humibacter albus]
MACTTTQTVPPRNDHKSPTQSPGSGLTIGVLVLAAFVMFLNETVLSVALKTLGSDLALPTATIQWVTSVFLLTMAIVIPTTGYLLERFTERQVFFASTLLFVAGTLACALSPGFAVLIAGRVLQAAGTALIMPLLMTTVMRLIPTNRRGTVIGTIIIVTAVAPALGPTLGGLVLGSLGWRWLFWLVLPLMAVVIVIGAAKLRPSRTAEQTPLDLLSVPLTAVGFGALLYGLSTIGEGSEGRISVTSVVSLVVGVIALAAFIGRQLRLQRKNKALLDLRAFTHRRFAVAVGIVCLLFTCMMALTAVLLPLYLQTSLAFSATASGLAMLPGGLAMGLLGPVVGRLYDRWGARPLVIPGAALTALALVLFALTGTSSPVWMVIMMHVLIMAGISIMMAPLNTDALSSLPEHLYSHGSAILNTVQQVAGALGIAVFVTISTLASTRADVAPDAAGLHTAFTIMAAVGVAAFGLSFLVRRAESDKDEPTRTDEVARG